MFGNLLKDLSYELCLGMMAQTIYKLQWFKEDSSFSSLWCIIKIALLEDFVWLPWNFTWVLDEIVSSDAGSNFLRIGNCFLWFLHVPL